MDTDASSKGIGAVLLQVESEGVERPISFASRTLSSSESNYSTIEREALAIVYGLHKFNQYLFGRKFIIRTDHKPLEQIFSTKRPLSSIAISRLQRWALLLGEHQYKVIYKSGPSNVLADTLSRMPSNKSISKEEVIEGIENINILRIHFDDSNLSKNKLKRHTMSNDILIKIVDLLVRGWPEKSHLDRKYWPCYEMRQPFSRR
ncbi:Retrovirus-related Pol polyprotein [Thelohanellus kitauei]|uniref:Retrovirus-related Pol polyprotein n=1 Tax=Thelohanellus kitauei TaxID=669202 RepID=A0A0C2MNH1_THEKT|nr:Retrovirus-related Pol polyprotein [Thelohanellus kitauei]